MVVGKNRIDGDKNIRKLQAILMAMAMQRYEAMHIAQWSTSRAKELADISSYQTLSADKN
jgi:hypothetical protein